MEADFEANAVFYRYWTGDNVNCSGYLSVEGGSFLGIPVSDGVSVQSGAGTAPPADEDEDDVRSAAPLEGPLHAAVPLDAASRVV
eukprot:1079431-Rhodomonas_salina.1